MQKKAEETAGNILGKLFSALIWVGVGFLLIVIGAVVTVVIMCNRIIVRETREPKETARKEDPKK